MKWKKSYFTAPGIALLLILWACPGASQAETDYSSEQEAINAIENYEDGEELARAVVDYLETNYALNAGRRGNDCESSRWLLPPHPLRNAHIEKLYFLFFCSTSSSSKINFLSLEDGFCLLSCCLQFQAFKEKGQIHRLVLQNDYF